MGLFLLILLLLFVIPITLGIIFLFRSKQIAILMFSVPLLVIIGIFGWWMYEVNHHFVRSTDLTHESLGGIPLLEELNESFKETYGDYAENDNTYDRDSLVFERFRLGTNNENKIVYVSTNDTGMQTAQNIKVGDSIQSVKHAYGDEFYTYRDMGMPDSINYVDRNAKIHLQFWYDEEDKITEITLQESSNH